MDRDIPDDERSVEEGREARSDKHHSRPEDRREIASSARSRPSPDKPNREYQLTDSEQKSLADIGRFRTVSTKDLSHQLYGSNASKLQQYIRHLSSHRLFQTRSVWLGKGKDQLEAVTITRRGK